MAGIKLHKPIVIVVLAAITPLLLITLLHLDDLVSRDLSWNMGLLFLVGIVYTHFFEYGTTESLCMAVLNILHLSGRSIWNTTRFSMAIISPHKKRVT